MIQVSPPSLGAWPIWVSHLSLVQVWRWAVKCYCVHSPYKHTRCGFPCWHLLVCEFSLKSLFFIFTHIELQSHSQKHCFVCFQASLGIWVFELMDVSLQASIVRNSPGQSKINAWWLRFIHSSAIPFLRGRHYSEHGPFSGTERLVGKTDIYYTDNHTEIHRNCDKAYKVKSVLLFHRNYRVLWNNKTEGTNLDWGQESAHWGSDI